MASAVDICNLSLSLLGERAEVTSISPPDGSAESQHCGRFYPMARDELLEMHGWTFAARRIALAEVVNDRPGWAYAYALPTNCLKARAVLALEARDDEYGDDFLIESGTTGSAVLYTDRPEATLLYTVSITDTTRFTPLFTAALARLLAVKLAGVVIKGATGMQVSMSHEKLFLLEKAEAATADSNAGSRRDAFKNRVPDGVAARGATSLRYYRGGLQ